MPMTTARSRANKGKGRKGEHEWAQKLRDQGWIAKRRLLSGAHTKSGAGDVAVKHPQNPSKLWGTWEVKRKKKLPKWLVAWASRRRALGLAMRADGQSPWFVVLTAEEYFQLGGP